MIWAFCCHRITHKRSFNTIISVLIATISDSCSSFASPPSTKNFYLSSFIAYLSQISIRIAFSSQQSSKKVFLRVLRSMRSPQSIL